MKQKLSLPIVVYDNQCYLCVKFAKIVNFLARGKLTMIGHYSEHGENIRNLILDETALDMFWFIDKKTAHGGRAALFPLIKAVLFSKKKASKIKVNPTSKLHCKSGKAVFFRSASLIRNSKKINHSTNIEKI